MTFFKEKRMRLEEAAFTIFDFETTGLYPYSGDRICEIGAVRAAGGRRRLEKFHRMVDPKRQISHAAFCVNGITEDMVKGKPTIDRALPGFLKFIEGSVLVAYNAGFDLGFLESALGDDRKILNDYLIIDALGLARGLFPNAPRYNLGALSQSLGFLVQAEHRAMADAMMTWKIFEKELRLLKSNGVKTVEEIAANHLRKRPSPPNGVKDYKLKLIEDAIRDLKRLEITYRSVWNNAVTKRTVTPLEIRRGYDKSYLIAHCHLKNGERNFRLDGIIAAETA
jgi:DNA polymerase-3 subunit epsilon